jgi:hypothetical protein
MAPVGGLAASLEKGVKDARKPRRLSIDQFRRPRRDLVVRDLQRASDVDHGRCDAAKKAPQFRAAAIIASNRRIGLHGLVVAPVAALIFNKIVDLLPIRRYKQRFCWGAFRKNDLMSIHLDVEIFDVVTALGVASTMETSLTKPAAGIKTPST